MLQFLFPFISHTHCLFCRSKCALNMFLCYPCQQKLPKIFNGCKKCRHPIDPTIEYCPQCLRNPPAFDTLFTNFYYEQPLSSLLHRFKYNQFLHLKQLMSELLMQALPSNYKTECFVPVPLHRYRLYQRGFNQSILLSKQLSKAFNISNNPYICMKIKQTVPQASLSARERIENLKQAFYIYPSTYQHVTIVDDIFTTGNTVNSLAKALKDSGIHTVNVACVARGKRNP